MISITDILLTKLTNNTEMVYISLCTKILIKKKNNIKLSRRINFAHTNIH